MKRDMDLIRKILLLAEEHTHGQFDDVPKIDGFTDEQVGYHCHLIGEAGLGVVLDVSDLASEGPMGHFCRLTWAGHEFLDASRDLARWERVKSAAGSAAFTVVLQSLLAIAKTEVFKRLGLGPPE